MTKFAIVLLLINSQGIEERKITGQAMYTKQECIEITRSKEFLVSVNQFARHAGTFKVEFNCAPRTTSKVSV
jgi:hypothetical protein